MTKSAVFVPGRRGSRQKSRSIESHQSMDFGQNFEVTTPTFEAVRFSPIVLLVNGNFLPRFEFILFSNFSR